ncbi:hypothetical protein F5Y18DRAFT_172190 [Xylariaceae sp. FL1019]|nr:hypothetical protein F5Y18DRAFT_172190 [Xylariaceae sp. FL1019]
MATGDTAPPPLSIPPPQIEPLSDDDGSSPLSDVEDKDDDPDDLRDSQNSTHNDNDDMSIAEDHSDANDTEAETERLYDTPQQPTRHKDVVFNNTNDAVVYERTPSKLRHHNKPPPESNVDPDTALSDEDVSMASSPPAPNPEPILKRQSPTLDILAEAANQEAESRKRKRSSAAAEVADVDQPSRKRTESVPPPSQPPADGDTAMVDEDEPSLNTNSGDHSVDEIAPTAGGENEAELEEPAPERPTEDVKSPKKQTRSSSRKLKDAEDSAESDKPRVDGVDGVAPEEEEQHAVEDEHMEGEADGEAEAIHKNEEELERKKAAFDQLQDIEKRFSMFRDRMHEERLEQLNKEEEMLKADIPTHPEYLAMMQCIDARRDERIRVADMELKLNLETSERWAVARRAQIHSQYFQAVRESRERILAELGQHWHAIQQERRKHANVVPDFGIRFPKTQAQRVRNALAYNKEVSILSGVAKYEGMPAAPDMLGATDQEMEDDFVAMDRNRQPLRQEQEHEQALQRPSFADYGGVPLVDPIGAAGEQFLAQTPWANPHHPSNAHLLQRQHSGQQDSPLLSSTSAAPRRTSHQPNPFSISSGSQPFNDHPFNGHSKSSKHVPRQVSTSPDVKRAASLLQQTKRGQKITANLQDGEGAASFLPQS